MRFSGTLRSPVVFTNGHETLEPIDVSGAHESLSINGHVQPSFPLQSNESLTYTCSGNALTEADSTGDVYTYRRLSSIA